MLQPIPKIRSIYDGQQDDVSQASGLSCAKDKIITKQSDKEACDINFITKRYERTGALPDLIKRDPRYGDFSDVPDYQQALELISLADAQFSALDAPIRARFSNDPSQFLGFATNPENLEELIKLGLATRKAETPPPSQLPPDSPAPAAAAAPLAGGSK